jgi:hypothetical protein
LDDVAAREQTARRETDRLVLLLYRRLPPDDFSEAAFNRLKIRDARFAELKPDHLEFDFWSSGVKQGYTSPRTVEQLLEKSPAEQLDYFLSFTSGDPMGESREGLLETIGLAAAADPRWAVGLLQSLAAHGAWESDIWSTIFWKVPLASLPTEAQEWTLSDLVAPLSGESRTRYALSQFLFAKVLVSAERDLDAKVLEKLLQASLTLWRAEHAAGDSRPPDDFAKTDWVLKAINLTSGQIVEFWLRYTQKCAAGVRDFDGWPAEIAPEMDLIAKGEKPADWESLAILGRHLDFVRAVAGTWTRQRLYSWFDFAQRNEGAWILWRSFVGYGNFNRDLILELPPYFAKVFGLLATADKDWVERFSTYVAVIVFSGLWDVTSGDWLQSFLLALSPKLRANFAAALGRSIRDIAADSARKLWRQWMHTYWQERLNGRPVPLTAEENGEMAAWLWPLPADEFAAGVSLLLQGPEPTAGEPMLILERTFKGHVLSAQPTACLTLLRWLLQFRKHYYGEKKEFQDLLEQLPRDPALGNEWLKICHELALLGTSWAGELSDEGKAHFQGPATDSAV